MNKSNYRSALLAAVAAVTVSQASAQVNLLAGWNFGQFIGAGAPSTDGLNGVPGTSIPSNYSLAIRPTDDDSGTNQAGKSDVPFAAGTGLISFDSTSNAAASDWLLNAELVAGNVLVGELNAIDAANGTLVNFLSIYNGDVYNSNLRFIANGSSIRDFTISLSTAGYADYNAGDFAQPNDSNLTLSAFRNGASGSIEWFFNGSSLGVTAPTSGTFAGFSVDLPAKFYGQSSAVLVGRVTGDIVIDNVQINGVTAAIPEPSTYAVLAGLGALALASFRRRRSS